LGSTIKVSVQLGYGQEIQTVDVVFAVAEVATLGTTGYNTTDAAIGNM
jgi:hypothetical protein